MTVNRRAVLALTGPAAAAFLALALVVAGRAGPVLSFDAWVSGAARTAALAHPLWGAVMSAITVTGSTAVIGPLAALGCAILLAYGQWRQALFVATALIATISARLIVVAVIARPRPADRLAPASNFSFPSGHSTASATAALILVVICVPLLRRRWSRILLAALAGTWAFLVGLSRVALVVHWPTDVLGARRRLHGDTGSVRCTPSGRRRPECRVRIRQVSPECVNWS